MSVTDETPVKIISVEQFPAEELLSRLPNLTMLKDREVMPYKDAFISLENIAVEELHPAQRYVLKKELLKVRALKWQLQEGSC